VLFGARVGFSGTAELMVQLSNFKNPRWRYTRIAVARNPCVSWAFLYSWLSVGIAAINKESFNKYERYYGPGRCPLAYLLYANGKPRLCINIHHYTPLQRAAAGRCDARCATRAAPAVY